MSRSKVNFATNTAGACPCGTNLSYEDCCGQYHSGKMFAPTPEKLMRSRYSAYVFLLEDYLLQSWHAKTRPVNLNLNQENASQPKKWLGLKIVATQQISPDEGTVEFIAKYKIGGKAYKQQEISDFVLEENRWFYVNGLLANP